MLAKMPIFGADSTTFDEAVENVTAETMTSENWALMVGDFEIIIQHLLKKLIF